MNRVTADTDRIRHLIQEMCTTAIYQLIILVASAALLFTADWRLALVVLLPAPFVAYLHYYIWRRVLHKLFHKQWRISDKANSFLHDVLSGIRVVKAFGQEERKSADSGNTTANLPQPRSRARNCTAFYRRSRII